MMSKLMSLEILSNIKDAKPSQSVEKLFDTVRDVASGQSDVDFIVLMADSAVEINELREDKAIESTETERKIIIENFPLEKNNYLVVPKVIEE